VSSIRDTSRAKNAAQEGPVFITDRGEPKHVLLSIEDYQRLVGEAASLYLSAITLMELTIGALQKERRDTKRGRRAWLEERVLPEFGGRVLPIDAVVAQRCAQLHVPFGAGCFDAATALVHGMTVVTRNSGDFASTGVLLANPWRNS